MEDFKAFEEGALFSERTEKVRQSSDKARNRGRIAAGAVGVAAAACTSSGLPCPSNSISKQP